MNTNADAVTAALNVSDCWVCHYMPHTSAAWPFYGIPYTYHDMAVLNDTCSGPVSVVAGLLTRELRSSSSTPPPPACRVSGIVKSRAVEAAFVATHDRLQQEYAENDPILYLTQADQSNHWGFTTVHLLVGMNKTGEGWVCSAQVIITWAVGKAGEAGDPERYGARVQELTVPALRCRQSPDNCSYSAVSCPSDSTVMVKGVTPPEDGLAVIPANSVMLLWAPPLPYADDPLLPAWLYDSQPRVVVHATGNADTVGDSCSIQPPPARFDPLRNGPAFYYTADSDCL
ncbi:uncharacterized protein LOC125718503 isoform X2 [Brienomyrus brachyistius]|uniref:uncharacterized protein LOC125718503 isoform X2 n=1 Tax=Brienomyrus brachyistius TaxID=42636 RepID=UPI0020B3C871|nr:uncharacterized protein LOC125718503 isoform X2 [Brienomyrus brachyistius]